MFQRCVAVDFYDFTTKAASQYGFTMQYYNIIILQSVKRFLIKLKKKKNFVFREYWSYQE